MRTTNPAHSQRVFNVGSRTPVLLMRSTPPPVFPVPEFSGRNDLARQHLVFSRVAWQGPEGINIASGYIA